MYLWYPVRLNLKLTYILLLISTLPWLRHLFRNTFISGCLTLLTALAGHHSYAQNVVRGADLQEQVKAGVKIVKDSTASPATEKGSWIPVPVIVTEPALGGIGGGVSLGPRTSQ